MEPQALSILAVKSCYAQPLARWRCGLHVPDSTAHTEFEDAITALDRELKPWESGIAWDNGRDAPLMRLPFKPERDMPVVCLGIFYPFRTFPALNTKADAPLLWASIEDQLVFQTLLEQSGLFQVIRLNNEIKPLAPSYTFDECRLHGRAKPCTRPPRQPFMGFGEHGLR